MVGLLLVSHGQLAASMLSAVEMIIGKQDGMGTIGLFPEDGIDDLQKKVAKEVNQLNQGEGVLILVDLLGGSPFNASSITTPDYDFPVDIVTGFNLGMLLEVLTNRPGQSLAQLVNLAFDAGVSSIQVQSRLFAEE